MILNIPESVEVKMFREMRENAWRRKIEIYQEKAPYTNKFIQGGK